jgi:hypothetical protein
MKYEEMEETRDNTKSLKTGMNSNGTERYLSYLTDNTECFHYKENTVNCAYGRDDCLL